MSPTPEPAPGTYCDTTGTPYEATKHPKNGWWLKKLARLPGNAPPQAYPKPDFPAAVNAGIFTRLPDQQAR